MQLDVERSGRVACSSRWGLLPHVSWFQRWRTYSSVRDGTSGSRRACWRYCSWPAVTWLVGWRQHGTVESLVSMILVEVLFVVAIGFIAYGGVPRLDSFFFAWFVPGNLFVALPWLVGIVLGAWILRRRSPA